jgi:hypothetical protein
MPCSRAASVLAPQLAALIAGAVFSWIAPVSHAAEPPGSAAKGGEQRSIDSKPSGNLSERLKESEGVIKPPENVDPGIQKKPPEDSGKMPVIPPPGAPGGDPNVKPK